MSIIDAVSLKAKSATETQNIGVSLAQSLYTKPLTVVIEGELGAGKTTFTQGLAKGLGIKDAITSPTYALEQRYGNVLSHLDLYRLKPEEAKTFVAGTDEWEGTRVIEWPERAGDIDCGIRIKITEEKDGRLLTITCHDIRIPSDEEIELWYEETMIQPHIVAHMRCVAEMADKTADALIGQERFVRRKALRAAALTHDILRYTDFKTFDQNGDYPEVPKAQKDRWTELKERYGTPHEFAAQRFIAAKGYPELGFIVQTHRGASTKDGERPDSIEQMALMYADKRSLYDKPVTVDERFDDFMHRYGNGTESESSKAWRAGVKRTEQFLFPDGVPF